MTRESKLALIVGFGLILFVGILVSDHFSSGQRQEAAHLLAQRGGLRSDRAPISIQPLEPASSSVTHRVSNELNGAGGNGAGNPSGEASGEAGRGPSGQGAGGGNPNGPGGSSSNGEVVLRPERRGPQVIGPGQTPTHPDGTTPGRQGAEEARGTGPTGPSAPPVPVVDAKLYPVKEGETLFSICAAQYGDGALWPALAEFNKSAVPNPARMRKGVTLRLPPISVLRPSPARGAAPSGSPAPGAPAAPVNVPAAPSRLESPGSGSMAQNPNPAPGARPDGRAAGATNYTVQRGDRLSRIAEKTLGSQARWTEIAKLNQDVIPDPNDLTPGTVIRIPSKG